MTMLPKTTKKKLGLVTDLDICVGCHACAVNCKEWNTGGYSAPLSDRDPYGADVQGVWLNRIHGYEVEGDPESDTVENVAEPVVASPMPNAPAMDASATGGTGTTRRAAGSDAKIGWSSSSSSANIPVALAAISARSSSSADRGPSSTSTANPGVRPTASSCRRRAARSARESPSTRSAGRATRCRCACVGPARSAS